MDQTALDDVTPLEDSTAISKSSRGAILPSKEAQLPLLACTSGVVVPTIASPLAEKIRRKRSRPLVSLSLFPEDNQAATKKPGSP